MGLVTERAGKAAYGVVDRDAGPRRPSPADGQQVQPGGDKDVPLVKGQLWGTPCCPGPGSPLPHEGLPPSRGPGPPTHSWYLRGLFVPEPSACLSQRDEVTPLAPSEGKQLEGAAAPWP